MKQVMFVELGMGADLHGQDVTKAAVRAVRNAIERNSMPGMRGLVGGDTSKMQVRVHLAVPADAEKLNQDAIDVRVAIQSLDFLEQLGFGERVGKDELRPLQAELARFLCLVANVDLGGRVVSHADGDETRRWGCRAVEEDDPPALGRRDHQPVEAGAGEAQVGRERGLGKLQTPTKSTVGLALHSMSSAWRIELQTASVHGPWSASPL